MDLLANSVSCLPAVCACSHLLCLSASYTVAAGFRDARARCGEVDRGEEESGRGEKRKERGLTGPRWPT